MWYAGIQFQLKELLGEGSQGRVYRALRYDRASGLRQVVAIKILRSRTAVDQWRQEFESLVRVRSPYCVQVLSFERYRRQPALVLEYIDGVSLAQFGQTCILDANDVQEILAQVECGLKDLHSHGIFHGDLSPHNILLDPQGRVRLVDFGLANCARENARVTPEYASPERLQGEAADAASDLFALGKIAEYLNSHPHPAFQAHYLCATPADRHFQSLPPCDQKKQNLSLKIARYKERLRHNGALKTRTQVLLHPNPRSLRSFLCGVMGALLALTSSSAMPHSSKYALLCLRTRRWHHFSLNGRTLGYSPVNLALTPGENLRLQWVSAQGHGTKEVRLKPQEVKILEDSDFSH